jgi:hypothetical protein
MNTMKKIIILSLMSFLFVSCGTKEENEEFSTGSEVKNTQETDENSVEDGDNNTTTDITKQSDTTNPITNDSWEKDSTPIEKDIDTNSTPQSDDQLVEDTIKDIESLFNDIEESVK